jgi:hypothetical protein
MQAAYLTSSCFLMDQHVFAGFAMHNAHVVQNEQYTNALWVRKMFLSRYMFKSTGFGQTITNPYHLSNLKIM